jgi:hypothetical protein
MEKDSFGETYISFPLIGKKENSTYYKTFYSGFQTNKTKTRNKQKNLSNPKPGRNSSKIIIERNRAVSSFGKYASQLQNNIYSKNKGKRLTSLVKNKNSFSSAETDDTFFALSEIKMMDQKIGKRVNKGLIWKEKLHSIYDICTLQNKKDIEKVREGVRTTDEVDKNFDLREEIDKKKYFPIEKVDTINEAKKIMKNLKNAMNNEKKAYETFYNKNRIDLHTFVKQNRDICKKNFVIDLLRNESNKIKTKEKEIKKALEDANRIFIRDEEAFDNFTLNKKRQFRETDFHLDEAIRNNKLLMEQIKKYNSEVHGTESEIERNIKGIILYKNYADFIHKLLGKDKINVDIKNIKNNLQNKEKDLIHLVKHIIKQFHFLLNSNEIPVKTEEINNPDLLTGLFFSLEGSIIQQMSIRDEIMKEKFKQKIDFDSQIVSLQKKIEEDQRNLDVLYKELELEKIGYVKYNYQDIIDDAYSLICEINEVFNYSPMNAKGVKKQTETVINNTFEIIHKMEEDLNMLFNEMERIQGDEKNPDELFRKIVEKIKLKNKAKKHQEGREALQKIEDEKNLKYLQRMNRYKIRGPIVYPPPWVLKKKKGSEVKNNKEDENDEEMLYYN